MPSGYYDSFNATTMLDYTLQDNKKQKNKILCGSDYNKFLRTPKWKEFSRNIKILFSNECWFCNSKEKLILHHTKYYKTTFSSKRKLKNNIRWFLVVCNKCHEKIHKIQNERRIDVYKATKQFRDLFYPHKEMSIPKRRIINYISEDNKKLYYFNQIYPL